MLRIYGRSLKAI